MSIVRDIKQLKIQGASEIAKAALIDLNSYGRNLECEKKEEFVKNLEIHADRLKDARPTEPALQKCVGRVVGRIKKTETQDVLKLKKELFMLCKEEILLIKVNLRKIEEHGAKLIPKNAIILTHCHSHNVVNILKKADPVKVYTTESRPRFQGRITAKELAHAGIEVEMILDDEVADIMKEVDLVMMGADAITKKGVVNKVGSNMIALVADRYKKPLYIGASTLKITDEIEIEERSRDEVWKDAPKNIKIRNYAFDIIPYRYIAGIITENGPVLPKDIKF